MPAASKAEVWATGEGYERYVGRWSRPVAREFVRWLGAPAGGRWLDVGCGTGSLVETVLALAAAAAVSGVDRSEGYLSAARRRLAGTIAELHAGDATALPFETGSFDHAVSGLVLNFVPDKEGMVAEMRRVVRPGGTVALYVWDYAGEMQMMRYFWDAAIALDPSAADLDEGRRFPICRPDAMAGLFRKAGLTSIETRAIEVPTVFAGFADFWEPFLIGDAPAPGYCMSLNAAKRERLRKRLSETLPVSADGRIELSARAWAVRGASPEGIKA